MMENRMPVHVPPRSVSAGIPLALTPQWGEAEGVSVSLRMNHDSRYLYLHFAVMEPQLRRMCTHHNDAAYTDSCVEVFLQREGEPSYVNFEFSAAGYLLAEQGTGRDGRTKFPVSLLEQVPIAVTIAENTIDRSLWHLDASLDLSLFGLGTDLSGLQLRGNFYKCGDGLRQPHYLSYAPVGTLRPDFHVPASFVPIVLD